MTDALSPTPAAWDWLADTYWYVPPASLPALRLDNDTGALGWMVDQTVWHITGYADGYLWGVSATLLWPAGEAPPARGPRANPVPFTLLGSITPEGRAYFTFVPQVPGAATTVGVGRAVPRGGGWSLEMQMSTGSDVTLHWAYMLPVTPADPEWDSLPGAGISVTQMLEGCEVPQAPPSVSSA